MEQNNRYSNQIKYLVIFIPVIIYFSFILKYAVNIPQMDDYDAVLGFMNNFIKAPLGERFALLFSQHNEHRILSSRIVYVLYYYITGSINFKHLIFIGNAQLILLLLLIMHFIKKCLPGQWFIPSLVASMCLFDTNNWENVDFAMASMQNFGIILLFTASIYYYYHQGKWAKYIGGLLQIITIFSSGNGIVAAGIICLFTFLKRDKLSIILSTLILLICAPLYFVHYVVPATGHMATNYDRVIVFFLDLTGAHSYYDRGIISLLAGSITMLLIILAFPFHKKELIKKELQPIVCIILFLLASMATATLFRCNLLPGYGISSRYLIYPNLLACLTLVLWLYKVNGKKVYYPVLGVSTLALLAIYIINTTDGKKELARINNTIKTTDYYYPDKTAAKRSTDESCKLNIYCIEQERNK